MRLFIASVASAAIALAAGSTVGQEITASISKIDRQMDKIILDNGYSYRVSDDIAIEGLSEGIEITVTYRDEDGTRVAVGIAAVEDPRYVHHLACARYRARVGG